VLIRVINPSSYMAKNRKNKLYLLIISTALIIGGVFVYFIISRDNQSNSSPVGAKTVTKVIDGDTVIVEGGASVRLLGIDADEKSYPCYDAAKNRLEELVLGKEVVLEKDQSDQDQYKRYLRYLILDDQNIDLQLVEEGLAVARFSPENQKYKEKIQKAETAAKEKKIGCKWGGVTLPREETKTEFKWEKLTAEATGLEVIGDCQAGNFSGKEKIIEGKVADAYKSKTNTVFINFDKPYPNHCFVAVIFSANLYKFIENPEKYYANKTVRIKGVIKEYEGKPEVILSDPSQIEVGE